MPKDPASEPRHDQDELFVLNDALGGFTVNGKGLPATAPYTAKVGQRIRFRFMNEGNGSHPVHLFGFPMLVFARDGRVGLRAVSELPAQRQGEHGAHK